MDTNTSAFAPATASLMCLMLVAAPGTAQSGSSQTPQKQQQQQPKVDKPEPRIVRQDILIGADVTNGMEGDGKKTLGNISDLIIDSTTGAVRHAVLSSGGVLGIGKSSMLVPWGSLTWDAKHSVFTSTLTEEAVAKLPVFEPDKLSRLDKKATEAAASKGGATAREPASTADPKAGTGKDATAARDQVLLASALDGCEVFAFEDKLGTCGKLFIETGSGSTAFLSVDSGGVLRPGEALVAPWAALHWQAAGTTPMHVRIDKSQADLATAPRLDDRGVDLSQPQFRGRVYEFYGVQRPGFEPAREQA